MRDLNTIAEEENKKKDAATLYPKEFGKDSEVYRAFSIKRGTLRNLHLAGKIQKYSVPVTGAKNRLALWDMKSIRDFIQSCQSDLPK